MNRALSTAREHPDLPVPLHLRNAPTKLMKDLGYNQGYEWRAGFKDTRGFLPDELAGTNFFND
jgi:putative ATPase